MSEAELIKRVLAAVKDVKQKENGKGYGSVEIIIQNGEELDLLTHTRERLK